MRAQEFVTERKKSREDFEGMTIEMVENGHVLVINALDDWGNNVLGSVAFNIHDNNELDPQDLKVDERYQGQGIAKVMYDYAKSKGYEIHRSYDQTDAGAGFWNKHRGEDVRVWEQSGDKKSAVRRIQKMLNHRFNANLDVDGVLGPLTQKTINRFMPGARPGSADEPNRTTAVQGKKLKTDNMAEAFDQPYKTKSEKSDYGDVDMLAKLPDGTNLSIMFNRGDPVDDVWNVEFTRNNSQEVTGEGDAQRIFATVIDAIQKYIKKYKPQRLSFSASKAVDMDADDNGAQFNPESRAKLYDRLVQRYSKALGYRAFRADNGDIVIYELSRLKPAVAEEQLDELSFLGSQCTKDCSGHRAGYEWSKRKGLRHANSPYSPSFNKGAALAVAGK